jgi:hypothetical protein
MNIYETTALVGVVQRIRTPHTALLDLFFPQTVESDEEEIAFDVEVDKRRVSPFVSPLIAGKVVQSKGFSTNRFKPAYIKDKRVIDPNRPLRRSVGEMVGGNPAMSAANREEANVARELADQVDNFQMRLELMAADAMLDGKVVVTGEGYDSVEVDFGRHADLTQTLLTTARWGESGVSPLANINTWRRSVLAKSGARVTDIVMGPGAIDNFLADDSVKDIINTDYRGNDSLINLAASIGEGAELQGQLGAGGPNVWAYSQTYHDSDDSEQNVLGDHQVVMGSRTQTGGVRYFGAIRDPKAGYQAMAYYPKSWTEEDPPVRFLMLQSAPLVVPTRINSTFAATTR